MRFYTNENFPFQVVLKLRDLGHDVKTSLDAGYANQAISDIEVLKTSISEQRILLILNRRDFIKLHQPNPNHHGIIVC